MLMLHYLETFTFTTQKWGVVITNKYQRRLLNITLQTNVFQAQSFDHIIYLSF